MVKTTFEEFLDPSLKKVNFAKLSDFRKRGVRRTAASSARNVPLPSKTGPSARNVATIGAEWPE